MAKFDGTYISFGGPTSGETPKRIRPMHKTMAANMFGEASKATKAQARHLATQTSAFPYRQNLRREFG